MGLFSFFKKKSKNKEESINIEDLKASLANYTFDNILKEGEHYTVKARVGNNILVKKIVRWAYCVKEGKNLNALFSIETDKGLYCFQAKDTTIYMVETNICTSMYPMLISDDFDEEDE